MKGSRSEFCRDLLNNKCYRGRGCQYRHHGPERPAGFMASCELYPPPEKCLTLVVDRYTEGVFSDGFITIDVRCLSFPKYMRPPKQDKVGTQTHRLRCPKKTPYDVFKRRFHESQQKHGKEVLFWVDHADPPSAVICGDTELLRTVQREFDPERKLASAKYCAICCEDCADFVRLLYCKHSCCIYCFRRFCVTQDGSKLPIECFDPNCDKLVPMRQMRLHLSYKQLLDLSRLSVARHVVQHPARFLRCPTPDCQGKFRLDGKRVQTCKLCSKDICAECHSKDHPGESCEDFRKRTGNDPEQLANWMSRNQTKKCPNCDTLIQKNGGCDHFQCMGCHMHLCFKCLAVFKDQNPAYKHIISKHGSYGDTEVEAEVARINAIHRAEEDVDNALLAAL
ncbi:hypothetical protein K470DRAFT_277069 [Piedraia hortae CBS 480.64]|uniref:Uncharacterized protein n=1 Tax=Piedraia hortae CBS 480.64 TaxID=1314780 RepID=A0A6A7BZ17_9PEZI|nr:hypothetical protein K470DRAFT_277069 [Piedraia hortae CBS 480.64]